MGCNMGGTDSKEKNMARKQKEKKNQIDVHVLLLALPMVLLQAFYTFANNSDINWQITSGDCALLVLSAADSVFTFVWKKKKWQNKTFFKKRRIVLGVIGVTALAFYYFSLGKEDSNLAGSFSVVMLLSFICLLVCALIKGQTKNESTKAKVQAEKAQRKEKEKERKVKEKEMKEHRQKARNRCIELFSAVNGNQKKILEKIPDDKLYCEMTDKEFADFIRSSNTP